MVCMSCCREQKQKKGLWSPDEDKKLFDYIAKYGHGCWCTLPRLAGLQRCGKSCRLRWLNYLKPGLKRGDFSLFDKNVIMEAQAAIGNRWSVISKLIPGRTDNEIKNFWNSCIKKKLNHMEVHPYNQKPNELSSAFHIDKRNAYFSAQGNYSDFVQQSTFIESDFLTVNLDAAARCFTSMESPCAISSFDVSPAIQETGGSYDLNLLIESAQDLSRYTMAEMEDLSEFMQLSQVEGDIGETLNC